MEYDIFFSISQTPVLGEMPDESQMFHNFFDQVKAADQLGYKTAWIAQSHLSTEVQKSHKKPVVPHWKGEIGLNVDLFQLAHKVFAVTKNMEVGSAVMNIICNGGPIAAAERIAYFSTLHGLDPKEKRKLNIGFSAGRFEFMNRAYGIKPRNDLEEAAWPALKGKVFEEACEIFLRLLSGETISSKDTASTVLSRKNFRSDEDWQKVLMTFGKEAEEVHFEKRYEFEPVKIIPKDFRRDLINLIIGSHDPKLQEKVNSWLPVMVFNLSITRPDIIEATHSRMAEAYHKDGGAWKRSFMPRTTFVFLNDEEGLDPDQQSEAAEEEARQALGAYWTALEGTLDPDKVKKAAGNALIGNPEQVAAQVLERFHPQDRLMLWFDFFNHDSDRVIRNMAAFMNKVRPIIESRL